MGLGVSRGRDLDPTSGFELLVMFPMCVFVNIFLISFFFFKKIDIYIYKPGWNLGFGVSAASPA